MHAGAHLQIDGLRQEQLVGQQSALGVDDEQTVREPLLVLHPGEPKVVLGRARGLAQAPDFLDERAQVGESIPDISIG